MTSTLQPLTFNTTTDYIYGYSSSDKVSLTQLGRGIRKKVDCYTDVEDLIVLADKAEGRREHLTDPEDEEEDLDEEAKAQRAKDEAE